MAVVLVAMTSIITTNGDEEDKKNKNKIPYGIISLSLYVGMNELVFLRICMNVFIFVLVYVIGLLCVNLFVCANEYFALMSVFSSFHHFVHMRVCIV